MSPKLFARNILIVASLIAVQAWAETPTATLVGRIVDASGGIVPGASVQVRDMDTNNIRTAESQLDGVYTVSNLAPGVSEVTIDKPGFRRMVEKRLEFGTAGIGTVHW